MIVGEFDSTDSPFLSLISGNCLFIKVWDLNLSFLCPWFKKTPLPGFKNNVSASIIGGFNIGINKYISEEKL